MKSKRLRLRDKAKKIRIKVINSRIVRRLQTPKDPNNPRISIRLRIKAKLVKGRNFAGRKYRKIRSYSVNNKYIRQFMIGFLMVVILYYTRKIWLIKARAEDIIEPDYCPIEYMGQLAENPSLNELIGLKGSLLFGIAIGGIFLFFIMKLKAKIKGVKQQHDMYEEHTVSHNQFSGLKNEQHDFYHDEQHDFYLDKPHDFYSDDPSL